ncbi:hypothetical protein MKX01_029475 [Papaver californicum]|nr:hypothetical protein MKX01_029475 [Papaver californicum]
MWFLQLRLNAKEPQSLGMNLKRYIFEDGKVTHRECKHYKKKMNAKSKNGTSSLRKYLKSCEIFKGSQKKINQMFLKASETQNGPVAAYNYKFNQEITRDCIARMIILHELPFSMVEYIGFRMLLTSLQPHIKLVKRNTTKSDCMKVFNMEKKHLYGTLVRYRDA